MSAIISDFWGIFKLILPYLVWCIALGLVTKAICRHKGYSGGFGWGFWLGFIGILICAVWRKRKEDEPGDEIVSDEQAYYKQLLDSGAITQEEYDEKIKQLYGI